MEQSFQYPGDAYISPELARDLYERMSALAGIESPPAGETPSASVAAGQESVQNAENTEGPVPGLAIKRFGAVPEHGIGSLLIAHFAAQPTGSEAGASRHSHVSMAWRYASPLLILVHMPDREKRVPIRSGMVTINRYHGGPAGANETFGTTIGFKELQFEAKHPMDMTWAELTDWEQTHAALVTQLGPQISKLVTTVIEVCARAQGVVLPPDKTSEVSTSANANADDHIESA